MKTFRRVLFFIAGICLLMACSKSDPFTDNDFNMSNLNKAGISIEEGDVYTLTGKALYQTWKVKDGTIIQDNRLDCEATLEFLEDRNFKYTFNELRPDGNAMEFYGKISASGTLTFQFPSPLFVFKGKFDGTKFVANAYFFALIMQKF